MRKVKTTCTIAVLMSLGLTSYAMAESPKNNQVRGADWDPGRAITQNLPVANHPSVPQNPYGSIDIERYLGEDEFPPYTRDRYRERDEPDVFSEDDTLYYDNRAFARDRFGYAKQRFKKAAQRYRNAKRNFSKEQLQFFEELDRFQAEKEQFASVSGGFAKTMLGTLQKRNGNIFVLENSDGRTRRVHVGEDTLVDGSVEQGDEVIAKVLPNGHAIALMKDRGEKGISAQPRSDMK
ncbi:hypothetical protein [Candidatus Nitronereus thalassa]|uniref:Uncharacterized protein n=1 Tax=Candidatus Nitronereus thalassa TaxID=3020898 RepID=A0ABU3KB51_9BACT|nr:hypothetical protein [Candidatus Nitronereus thalassa]MDT7043720.1 hypothetical protein [Candidatus Nitronereus thalassa]